MILHSFAWRSSKNMVLRPKTLRFDQTSKQYRKDQKKHKNTRFPRDPCGVPCGAPWCWLGHLCARWATKLLQVPTAGGTTGDSTADKNLLFFGSRHVFLYIQKHVFLMEPCVSGVPRHKTMQNHMEIM